MMSLKIGIVGHTNCGKTTLIRTLLRRPVGEVDDRANVTQLSESQEFHDFFANLIDTPGFQNAAGYLAYLSTKEKFGLEAAENIKQVIPLLYEEEVAKNLIIFDACIYVVSLEVVPDDTLLAEVNLVSSLSKTLLVVLNKQRILSEKETRDEAERRKKLWINGCKKFGVSNIMEFDAHWASPKTSSRLFEEIAKILPLEKRQKFQQGLVRFKDRQRELRNQAIEYAIECIVKCRKIDLSKEMKSLDGETAEEYTIRIKTRLSEMCADELGSFMDKAASLFALAAEVPTRSVNELGDLNPSVATSSKLEIAAVAATLLGALLGLAGAVVGVFAASVTVATGAGVGGAVGGGLGAILGFAGASGEHEKLQAIQAGYVAIICLDTLWLLSCYGWGKGAVVSPNLFEILEERTKAVVGGLDPINWHKASSNDIKSWIERFLDRVAE